jgi:hypothetical protein
MQRSVLTSCQIDQFIECGWTLLRNAFPRAIASEVRKRIWREIALDPERPETWKQPLVHVRKNFDGEPFARAFTPQVTGAFDDLMGEGRWLQSRWLGWWPVLFPGFAQPPWRRPLQGWHIDGCHFKHHLDSREQGLLPIFIFSDIDPGDGGTAIAERSHQVTSRILAESGLVGMDMDSLSARVHAIPGVLNSVIEATGAAGDVLLMHPFMLHATSQNTGRYVRFICNPCMSLHERMNVGKLDRSGGFSPVEIAINRALRQ